MMQFRLFYNTFLVIKKMEMLTSAFKTMVKNPVKESFLLKKTINILIIFFISHKSNIKILLKWIVKTFFFYRVQP